MFVTLELIFLGLVGAGFSMLTVGARRFNISNRGMAITFAITALSWMGLLLTTIALLVFLSQIA